MLVFYYLCHHHRLARQLATHEGLTLGYADPSANRLEQAHLDVELIARNNLALELHLLELHEVGRVELRIGYILQNHHGRALRHRLDDQHTRHDREIETLRQTAEQTIRNKDEWLHKLKDELAAQKKLHRRTIAVLIALIALLSLFVVFYLVRDIADPSWGYIRY